MINVSKQLFTYKSVYTLAFTFTPLKLYCSPSKPEVSGSLAAKCSVLNAVWYWAISAQWILTAFYREQLSALAENNMRALNPIKL